MRFSLFYNCDIAPGKDVPELYREIEAQAIAADRLGFDAIWLAEHHFADYGRLPAPLTFLARLSAVTERLDLGTAIAQAPYYHPLRLAEEAALIDVLSGGRLRLGIGSGARNKTAEFAKFGIPIEEKGARTVEVLDILGQALGTGHVDFAGEYFRFAGVELNPRPRQAVERLLWVAASRSTPAYAAERGYGFLIPRVGPGALHKELIARYRAALGARPGFVTQLRFVYVAATEREAHEQTSRTFARYARYDCGVEWDGRTDTAEYAELAERMHFLIGTPEQVAERLVAWQREYGFDEIICQLHAAGMRHEDSLRALELLGREVLPRLQSGEPAGARGR
jgi:alkanesulfonate monooxygenase SsuD/methylene tetrahydromethanopterin reductase-like flavin-dependent oxidoreductase (luciferase family)